MDILEFAINMEIEGEKFYKDQAEKAVDDQLKTVMLMLAKDESNHANILRNKVKELPYELEDNDIMTDTKSVFKGIEDFKCIIKDNPDQLDFYRLALDKERESIDLYEDLLSNATDYESKKLFDYLIDQEKGHYKFISELVTMLKHAEDWVEDAEFGLRREEY